MIEAVARKGLVLVGCGKMGGAMLRGWLKDGLPASSVWVKDPYPADWLVAAGVNLNTEFPADPAVAIIAVKPQMMGEALPQVAALGGGRTLVISVAAGTPIAKFEEVFGDGTPIIRAMPNTPAAIGRGITAIIGNGRTTADHMDLARSLLSAVGQVVELEIESQMDAVTAVSGSGPAYVFHLIETLAAAGEAEGLSPALAMALAKATVGGAGDLAEQSDETPSQLRVNVTSPNGTTQAALRVLMNQVNGFPALMTRAVRAAADRSRELARGE